MKSLEHIKPDRFLKPVRFDDLETKIWDQAKTNIPNGGETIMIIGNNLAAADIRTVAPALRAAANKVIYIGNFQHKNEVYRQSELEAATDAIVWITAEGEPISANRPQDYSVTGELLDVLKTALEEITSVIIVGDYKLIRQIQDARKGILKQYSPKFTASIHGPMPYVKRRMRPMLAVAN